MKKSEKTKQRLLEKAIETVATKGYSASSTKEIAKKAGVSEATLFKYYQSKDDLLKNIVIKTLDEFYNYSINKALPEILAEEKSNSVRDLLQNILSERLTFFQENKKAIQVIIQEMMINESIRDIFYKKVWTKMEQISTHIFNKGKKEGQIKEIDNYFLRKFLFGLLFYSISFESLFDSEQSTDYDSQSQAEMIIDLLFEGIKED